MPMVPETINDVLEITRRLHQGLSRHLTRSASQTDSERARMLMTYLAKHEKQLAKTLRIFQRDTDLGPLDTWFYNYTDRHKIVDFDPYQEPFAKMSAGELSCEIANLHNQLIDMYKHLQERAESDSAREVLSQLLDFETAETKLMSYEGGRSDDY